MATEHSEGWRGPAARFPPRKRKTISRTKRFGSGSHHSVTGASGPCEHASDINLLDPGDPKFVRNVMR
jgi:hypothetical protein